MLCYAHSPRRGSSFGLLLVIFAGVLAGALFFYGHIMKVHPLVMAGKQCIISKEYNQTADLEYRRHFKEHNQGNAQRTRSEMSRLVADTLRGKYAGKLEDFNQRYDERLNELLAFLSELDSNSVPAAIAPSHILLATSHRCYYDCLENLRLGVRAEGSEQKARFSDAQKYLAEGLSDSQRGESGILQMITAPR